MSTLFPVACLWVYGRESPWPQLRVNVPSLLFPPALDHLCLLDVQCTPLATALPARVHQSRAVSSLPYRSALNV